ncbi:hypothetical protein F4808DRAFT_418845 [Astrocystis sublimbata]|nr:hypothetical protein F4808DRAFT_418845 [Astrocystis sublimbata]
MSLSLRNRVCDRCIRKKVKCDLQRSGCSRCLEAGSSCTYSAARKKPGPSRGSRRAQKHGTTSVGTASTGAQVIQGNRENVLLTLGEHNFAQESGFVFPETVDYLPQAEAQQFENCRLPEPMHDLFDPDVNPLESVYPGYSLTQECERELLVHFFSEIHPAIPLFRIPHFLKQYDNNLADRKLVVAIVTIAAKILGPINYWKPDDVEVCMQFLLDTASETASSQHFNSLDSFRLDCLLAYYGFHQCPSSSSWMRISKLARKAYVIGVNQIENPDSCSAFDHTAVTEDDIEDWRYLFWCLYCLDSYSNILIGTPFVVELESINTALLRKPHDQGHGHGISSSISKIYLPDDIEDLWQTVKAVVSNGTMVNYNIHMITTTILRHAGYILRLRTEGKPLPTRVTTLQRAIASLRLSLPVRYLNPTRNALSGESCIEHHIRLTNVLHLHMATLIIAIPPRLEKDEAKFMQSWLETLEPCQNIVTVVEQWDNQHSPRIDPAICVIVSSALCFLELHRRSSSDPSDPLASSISRGQHLLLLFLEQFSTMWALPRFLIHQFKEIRDQCKDIILTCAAEIDRGLSRSRTPVHPKSLQRYLDMSTTPSDANSPADAATYTDDLRSFNLCENYNFDL